MTRSDVLTRALQSYQQVLNVLMVVLSALMIWKGLMVVTGSESPIVVVLRFVVILLIETHNC